MSGEGGTGNTGRGADYTVGYGKPPQHSRFVKGQSGNPKGRTKGRRNLSATLLAILNERVTVTENGRRRTISKLEAAFKQIVNRAAAGDVPALKLLIQLFPGVEALLSQAAERPSDAGVDQMILQQLVTRLKLGSEQPVPTITEEP
jgi:Family of unknown function (DUF5681)